MFFTKKNKKQVKCDNCGYKNNSSYSFCPRCGFSLIDLEKEQRDFGLLGRDDHSDLELNNFPDQGFGITDKLFNSMLNNIIKIFDKQIKNQFKEIDKELQGAEIRSFPNGIRIKISGPIEEKPVEQNEAKTSTKKVIDQNQLKKMSSLPRAKAKASVKRLGNKLVYELLTPGISSLEDVFVSRIESGYEIKVIGDKKIYVNSFPINLPLRRYAISKNKLLVEFLAN